MVMRYLPKNSDFLDVLEDDLTTRADCRELPAKDSVLAKLPDFLDVLEHDLLVLTTFLLPQSS